MCLDLPYPRRTEKGGIGNSFLSVCTLSTMSPEEFNNAASCAFLASVMLCMHAEAEDERWLMWGNGSYHRVPLFKALQSLLKLSLDAE